MGNKVASTILVQIITTLIMMFATSGAMYLLGNVVIGWNWLTFGMCVGITGATMAVVFTIIIIILDRKERKKNCRDGEKVDMNKNDKMENTMVLNKYYINQSVVVLCKQHFGIYEGIITNINLMDDKVHYVVDWTKNTSRHSWNIPEEFVFVNHKECIEYIINNLSELFDNNFDKKVIQEIKKYLNERNS